MDLRKLDPQHPFLELVPRSVRRANLGLAPFFFISDELILSKIWAYQSVIQLIVHKEPRVGGSEVSHV